MTEQCTCKIILVNVNDDKPKMLKLPPFCAFCKFVDSFCVKNCHFLMVNAIPCQRRIERYEKTEQKFNEYIESFEDPKI